jgi:hypothetical protein
LFSNICTTPLIIRLHLAKLYACLVIEETQMEEDIRTHDLYFTQLSLVDESLGREAQNILGNSYLVSFTVPGVGERRPALSLGDAVTLRPHSLPR